MEAIKVFSELLLMMSGVSEDGSSEFSERLAYLESLQEDSKDALFGIDALISDNALEVTSDRKIIRGVNYNKYVKDLETAIQVLKEIT